MLRTVWYFRLLVGVRLLRVSVLSSVECGLCISNFDYFVFNVIGVF